MAFDEPSFFADLRVDINPIASPTSSPRSSEDAQDRPSSTLTMSQQDGLVRPHPPDPTESASHGDSCVWVHRMVLAVHSPVFRSLLREGGGAREGREGTIDMRGVEHPPGKVVRCMLKMMYAAPGLAIDELGKEAKLSDEWEFLIQLFKLAHLYQVEVALDACARRFKHILERRDPSFAPAPPPAPPSSRPQRSNSSTGTSIKTVFQNSSSSIPTNAKPSGFNDEWREEEEEEKTKQTCYALELLAFLLHVKEAETRSPDSVRQAQIDNQVKPRAKSVSADDLHNSSRDDSREGSGDDDKLKEKIELEEIAGQLGMSVCCESREDLLMRMLDHHLFPQLWMIVQLIRCEDVLTLQHLLHLSVCRPTSSPCPLASLTPSPPSTSWSGSGRNHHTKHN